MGDIRKQRTEGLNASYTIPSTAFSDPDADVLTYTALLSSGAALPTWMKFDPATRIISGTPPRAVASYTIRVTAKNPYGLSVYDDFAIKINNKPSIGAYIPDLIWNENSTNTYTISTGFYKDIDGDALTYMATLSSGEALPTWMSFNC